MLTGDVAAAVRARANELTLAELPFLASPPHAAVVRGALVE